VALPLGVWLRLTLLGSAGSDTWSTSVWFRLGGYTVPTVAQLDTLVSAALTDFDSKVWSAASSPYKAACSTGTKLTGARGLTYTNNVLDQSDTHNITPIPGTGTSNHPMYVALVVTTQTGRAGRRNRGRMYLPATGATMASAGLFSSTQRDSVVDTLAARLSAVNALSDTATVAVISSVGTTAHPILTVSADQRPDIQRRRANRQAVGTSHSATVPV